MGHLFFNCVKIPAKLNVPDLFLTEQWWLLSECACAQLQKNYKLLRYLMLEHLDKNSAF